MNGKLTIIRFIKYKNNLNQFNKIEHNNHFNLSINALIDYFDNPNYISKNNNINNTNYITIYM